MRALRWTSPEGAAEDLGVEEAILLAVNAGESPPTIRFWSPPKTAVVIGTGQSAAREADLDAARALGVPVLRRFSGGGAVMVGPGAWNYSAFFPYSDVPGSGTIGGAARAVTAWIVENLRSCGIEARFAGVSDIAVVADGSERKIAGHSQARKKNAFCLHGTLLADPDFGLMDRLLPMPSETPSYRGGRSHRDFLTTLRSLGVRTTFREFAESVVAAAGARATWADAPSAEELGRGAELGTSKYASDAWTYRR